MKGYEEGLTPRQRYWRTYYQANKDRLKANIKAHRDANREQFRAQQREYRARNRQAFLERERAYYHAHRERILERKRESQRLRSKVRYWKDKDSNRYELAVEELNKFLEKRERKRFEANKHHNVVIEEAIGTQPL